MGYLVEIRERGKSNRRLVVDDRVEVGRTAADIRVEDALVSRRHLLLTVQPTGLAVLDLGSSNGTTVNGGGVAGEMTVRPGDVIGLGQSEIEVIGAAGCPVEAAGRREPLPQQLAVAPPAPAEPAGPAEAAPVMRPGSAGPVEVAPVMPAGPMAPAAAASAIRHRPLSEGFQERETETAIFRYRPGTAGERMLTRLVSAVARARRRLAGLGSEPWGVRPVICLVDPFPDPQQPGQLVSAGTVVDTKTGEIWMVVTAEAPPEHVERPLAVFFGAALPAAEGLGVLLEGFGLAVADVESPDAELRSRPLPPLAVADGELRAVMALSFVRYLIEKGGRAALLQVLSTAVPGRVDAAAAAVYGVGLAALEEKWRAALFAKRAPGSATFVRRSWRYVRANLRQEAELGVILLVQLSFSVVFPFASRRLLDDAIPRGDTAGVVRLLLILTGLFAVSLLAGLRAAYLAGYISGATIRRLRGEVFNRLQLLSPGWFSHHQQGDLLSRLVDDVTIYEMGLTQVLRDGAFQLLSLLTAAGVLVALSWQLGLLVLLGAVGVGLIYRFMGRGVQRRSVEAQEYTGALLSVAAENIAANPVVRAFGLESRERSRFRQASDRLFARELKLQLFGGLFSLSINAVATAVRLGALGVGAWLVMAGHLTEGTLVVVLIQVGQVIAPVSALSGVGQQLQVASGALVRLDEIIDAEPEVTDPVRPAELAPLRREIRFADVAFGYEDGERTLDGINVRIPARSKVAFVGPTGAGKSTLLQLLLRFYDVTAGGIFFDDTDIRSVSLAVLRRDLGVVFQETFLFDVSVRENIAIGMPSASVEEIEAAARAAGIHEFVMGLPRGYDTQVGERGVRLSGGQRQRLAIARAILRRPQVLLLDEATSALDPRTERAVMAAVSKAGEGRTTIAVTHRLTSVVDYDAIHVVVDGQIVESGRHEELLARGGVYADLWTEQTGQLLALPGGIDVTEALARIPLFQALGEQDLAQVVARMREVHLEPGQSVTEADARLYLLTDGQARVLHPTVPETAAPARLGPGDAFGLAALLGERTGAVLEAVSKVDLVALDALDLAHLMVALPALAGALAAQTSAGPREGIRLSRSVLRPWPVSPDPRADADSSLSRTYASWGQPSMRFDGSRIDVMGGAP